MDGVFSFGLSGEDISLDLDNPTSVIIKVEAMGYKSKRHEIIFDGTNQTGIYVLALQSEQEEAPGVVVLTKNKDLDSGVLSHDMSLKWSTMERI